jgi:hypothetical protein
MAAASRMNKRFVAINDEIHQMLRGLTSSVPLIVPRRKRKLLSPTVTYDLNGIAQKIPDLYFFIPYEGVNVCLLDLTDENKVSFAEKRDFFDATKVDKRCHGTARLRLEKRKPSIGPPELRRLVFGDMKAPSLFSAELLCFGVGALRRLWDNPHDPDQVYARKNLGRINSLKMIVYGRTAATYHSRMFNKTLPETWESTNIIYGDAYGELEQIWSRRDDKSLLSSIVRSLNDVRKGPKTENFDCYLPKDASIQACRTHLQAQSIWDTPILSYRELIKRVAFLLKNTFLDSNPATVLELHAHCEKEGAPEIPKIPKDPFEGLEGLLG